MKNLTIIILGTLLSSCATTQPTYYCSDGVWPVDEAPDRVRKRRADNTLETIELEDGTLEPGTCSIAEGKTLWGLWMDSSKGCEVVSIDGEYHKVCRH